MFKSIITKLIFSIIRPEKSIGSSNSLKEILKLPIIFDLCSFLIQLRFVKRIIRINSLENKSDHLEEVRNYNYSVTFSKLITRSRRAEIYYKMSSLIIPELSNKKNY